MGGTQAQTPTLTPPLIFWALWGGWGATMGQVCFTAISSNGARHPRSALPSVQCARSCSLCPPSECSMAGVRAKVPSSFSTVPGQLSPVELCGCKQSAGARPCAWSIWAGGEGGAGGRPAGVPGTPTYIPQNDPLIALIILNRHMWGF